MARNLVNSGLAGRRKSREEVCFREERRTFRPLLYMIYGLLEINKTVEIE